MNYTSSLYINWITLFPTRRNCLNLNKSCNFIRQFAVLHIYLSSCHSQETIKGLFDLRAKLPLIYQQSNHLKVDAYCYDAIPCALLKCSRTQQANLPTELKCGSPVTLDSPIMTGRLSLAKTGATLPFGHVPSPLAPAGHCNDNVHPLAT